MEQQLRKRRYSAQNSSTSMAPHERDLVPVPILLTVQKSRWMPVCSGSSKLNRQRPMGLYLPRFTLKSITSCLGTRKPRFHSFSGAYCPLNDKVTSWARISGEIFAPKNRANEGQRSGEQVLCYLRGAIISPSIHPLPSPTPPLPSPSLH